MELAPEQWGMVQGARALLGPAGIATIEASRCLTNRERWTARCVIERGLVHDRPAGRAVRTTLASIAAKRELDDADRVALHTRVNAAVDELRTMDGPSSE
jgi:hypothetical protein